MIDLSVEYQPWKRHVKSELLDYVLQNKPDGFIATVKAQVEEYARLEKTSLLELAIWRASCLHFDGSRNFHTMQDILDQWALNESFDPTEYKFERRFTGCVAVIMRSVISFL